MLSLRLPFKKLMTTIDYIAPSSPNDIRTINSRRLSERGMQYAWRK
jgi:hypothetical protein